MLCKLSDLVFDATSWAVRGLPPDMSISNYMNQLISTSLNFHHSQARCRHGPNIHDHFVSCVQTAAVIALGQGVLGECQLESRSIAWISCRNLCSAVVCCRFLVNQPGNEQGALICCCDVWTVSVIRVVGCLYLWLAAHHFPSSDTKLITRWHIWHSHVSCWKILVLRKCCITSVNEKDTIATISKTSVSVNEEGSVFVNSHCILHLKLLHGWHDTGKTTTSIEMSIRQDEIVSGWESIHEATVVLILQTRCAISGVLQTWAINASFRDRLWG